MSQDEVKRIGLIIGREWDWPAAFMAAVNERDEGITAELVKIGGAFMDEPCPYHVIIDRMSHEIPYYRAYLKYATLYDTYIINNPFTWSADNKFFGNALVNKLGLASPRTVALPNKEVERDVVPDSFRNLVYPMNWQGIIDYVGVPAIFKDLRPGGRRVVYRVHSVDELIQRYDESGTRTMLLQQIIESDIHLHCFVVGEERAMLLRYSLSNGRYLPGLLNTEEAQNERLIKVACDLTRIFGYDFNMVEFVVKDDIPYVINCTNPAPDIDASLMDEEQFNWCVQEIATLAIERARRPLPQQAIFNFDTTSL
jgi:glutathione synthase/RimK-type ligase-like ATP-grasp enzyme